MDFSDFRLNITLRVVVIALTIYLFAHLIYRDVFFITILLVLGLVVYQVISLINFMDRTNKEITSFFNSIRNNDFSQTYAVNEDGTYIDYLKNEFNHVMQKLTEIRAVKDEQYHYLKNIVQHVGIGLLTFKKDGEIHIINTAAKKLFQVDQISNIDELKNFSEPLVNSFYQLRTGGRNLIKIEQEGEIIQLAIYAIELTLRGEEFKLISVQNIHSELEENEMEAWQKLVRVLTHEIMNSVTPISSLANTVEQDMYQYIDHGETFSNNHREIPLEDLSDMHMAVKTIQRRSEGLIRFVSDFRSLAQVPKPTIKVVKVQDIFKQVYVLLRHELESNQIKINMQIDPESLDINADAELIQQVLINLIKNAIQALSEQNDRKIQIKAFLDDKGKATIVVKDNGPGIDEEAQSKIFIPFFTTKKTGSGIGLSLSRQIMRQHLGTISVTSKIDEGTEFSLKF